jgi:sec-independent protein translocase protein TatA
MIGGLGMQELLVILAIVMLLFGGKRLPELGEGLGKAIRGFKRAEDEATRELKKAAEGEETSDEEAERRSDPSTSSGQAGETEGERPETTEDDEGEEEDEKT